MWRFNAGKDFALGNSLFGVAYLTKNAALNKYSGYGVKFDAHESFLFWDGSGFGKNIVIYDSNMSSLVNFDIRGKIFSINAQQSL